MKTTKLVTVERLNEIQAEWMKFEKEKQRVFKLMEEYPKSYISGHDGRFVIMIDGTPSSALPWSLEQVLEYCAKLEVNPFQKRHIRTDIAWNGKTGQWYTLSTPEKQPAGVQQKPTTAR